MIQSFRLRLAIQSALFSGVVLAGFGVGSWWLIRSVKLERLDSELRSQADREVTRPRETPDWPIQEARLAADLGVRDAQNLMVWAGLAGGESIYQSPHWPSTLNGSTLPWPDPTRPLRKSDLDFPWLSRAHAQPAPRPGSGGGPGGGPGARPGPPPGPPPQGWDEPVRPAPWGGDAPSAAPPAQRAAVQPPVATPAPARLPDSPSFAPVRPVRESVTPVPAREPAAEPPPLPAALQAAPVMPPPSQTNAPLPEDRLLPPPPQLRFPPVLTSAERQVDGQTWRFVLASTESQRMALAVNMRVIDEDMKGVRNAFMVSFPFALVLVGWAGWFFAGRALQPVERLTQATRKVTADELSQRITVQGVDREFVELIEVFNRMLARLERSFEQAHRFTADAAHELKTPLAIVQGQLERAIQQASDGSPMQGALSSILDEVRRLSVISRKLLLLSQADAGRLSLVREPVPLSSVLAELLEDTRMLAPSLQIEGDIQDDLVVQADGSLLRQVLHNLISNAIKYNIDDGWIRISTQRWAQHVEIVVANSSKGISSAQRGKLFERFFRADAAHSRAVEGVGLGLSVSREIARAHGGDLTLKGDAESVVQFSLLLPI